MNKLSLRPIVYFAFFGLFLLAAFVPVRKNRRKEVKQPVIPLRILEKAFKVPPDSVQTSVYWYWISDNISKVGVVKDLFAMKKAGINRAFIGNIGLNDVSYGKVKIFSEEWWNILHAALKTASKLNIEIGIFNSPGWSQSGGPWIKPDQAMRYLSSSEITVKGNQKLNIQLKKPARDFQDVRVIAFPVPGNYGKCISNANATISASPEVKNIKDLIDGDTLSGILFPKTNIFTLDFEMAEPYTARSIVFYPLHQRMVLNGEIQTGKNGIYHTIKKFKIDRSNSSLNVGFAPYAPGAVSIPATISKHFRIEFNNVSPNSGLTEVKISRSPIVENYAEKSLAKMFPRPLPYWQEYQWPVQPVVTDKNLVIAPSSVIDISQHMDVEGRLIWNVPPGDWMIMRVGMRPTGVTNSPATPEGRGLEADKMSKVHIEEHFNAFLGKIIKKIPPEDRKTWKVTVEDSYETGGQNWTDGLIGKFKAAFGYDPLPYLPVMQGLVVGSEDQSDRFLWDMRRFIADKVAYEYVAGLRQVSHKYGLHTWLENYGHWGFPAEFLQYGGQSDEVAGEFWSEGELGNIENRAASSCAHIYGKRKVSAESFTAGGKAFVRYPALMKQRGDRFFTEGINNTLLHVYIEQPYEDKLPGVNAAFGNEFNRLNTWFCDLGLFTDYLKRCDLLLQQGKYVADAAYFIGEDVPKMTGIRDPELPKGYSYDYINAEVIQTRVSVKDGRLVLPDGISYSILVLPKLETMRPELLTKIKALINEGAVVLGPKPSRSPSLKDYPTADLSVQKIVNDLWGNIDGEAVKIHKYGKGMVLDGMTMQDALDLIHVTADFKVPVPDSTDSTLFIHRSTGDAEIYFISNQAKKNISFTPSFRVTGKKPELWDPLTGNIRDLPAFTIKDGRIFVPITLSSLQSAFILFRKKAADTNLTDPNRNFPEPEVITVIHDPWKVVFDTARWGPEKPVIFDKLIDWTLRPEMNIKYYSGTAVYYNTFDYRKPKEGQRILLDLGSVIAMAKIKVNGIYVGGVWTTPYSIDVTDAIKTGKNKLSIEVSNTWVNRLIGDSKLPREQRKTWTSINTYKPDSPLESSGLLGPVKVEEINYRSYR